jgi:hypothetical protein
MSLIPATQTDVFLANGVYNKPANAKFIRVILVGGGQGGNGGGAQLVGVAVRVLSAGSAGARVVQSFLASEVPSVVNITVGLGTAGAAGLAAPSIPPAAASGGTSIFGTLIQALGGVQQAIIVSSVEGAFSAVLSTTGGNLTGAVTAPSPVQIIQPSGGGNGGGITSANVRADGANAGSVGTGGATVSGTVLVNVLVGGIAGVGAGANGNNGNSFGANSSIGGSGGGGGAANDVGTGGNGGNGAFPGGGGGGGGASRTLGGNGGNGANGIVIVQTFF